LKRSAIFYGNRPSCVFDTPLGDLGATYVIVLGSLESV